MRLGKSTLTRAGTPSFQLLCCRLAGLSDLLDRHAIPKPLPILGTWCCVGRAPAIERSRSSPAILATAPAVDGVSIWHCLASLMSATLVGQARACRQSTRLTRLPAATAGSHTRHKASTDRIGHASSPWNVHAFTKQVSHHVCALSHGAGRRMKSKEYACRCLCLQASTPCYCKTDQKQAQLNAAGLLAGA